MGASSEHKNTALTNSQQLWLPAEGSHRLKLVNILAGMGKRSVQTLSLPKELLLVDGFWRKEQFLLRVWPPVG